MRGTCVITMPEKDSYIRVRMSSERKQRWQARVEEDPEWRSLSHLVVTAVEEELREDNSVGKTTDVDLGSMHERFDSVQEQLDDIEDRVDEVFILTRGEESEEVMEIAGEVLDWVPEPEDVDSLLSMDPDRFDSPEETARRTGKVSAIVRILAQDYNEFEIKQAIEKAEQSMATVRTRDGTPQADTTDKRIYRVTE